MHTHINTHTHTHTHTRRHTHTHAHMPRYTSSTPCHFYTKIFDVFAVSSETVSFGVLIRVWFPATYLMGIMKEIQALVEKVGVSLVFSTFWWTEKWQTSVSHLLIDLKSVTFFKNCVAIVGVPWSMAIYVIGSHCSLFIFILLSFITG